MLPLIALFAVFNSVYTDSTVGFQTSPTSRPEGVHAFKSSRGLITRVEQWRLKVVDQSVGLRLIKTREILM